MALEITTRQLPYEVDNSFSLQDRSLMLRTKYGVMCVAIITFFASLPNQLLMTFNPEHTSDGGGASPLFYVFAIVAYLGSIIGIGFRLNWNFIPVLRVWPLWLPVLYAILSVAWSVDPLESFSRSMGLLGTTFAAIYLSTYNSLIQLRYMVIAIFIVMAASLMFAVFVPSMGWMVHDGETVVRGIYLHKNTAGWISALFALIAYGALRARAGSFGFSLLVIILSAAVIFSSRSATGIIALFLGLLLYALTDFLRTSGRLRPTVIALVLIGFAVAAFGGAVIIPLILEYFGKTITFSGRTTLWEALIPAIEQKPLLGWGFGGAIWQTPVGRDFFKYAFFAGNAQGGYVEIIVNLGIIGLIFLFLPFLYAMRAMFKKAMIGDRVAQIYFVILTIMAVMGFTAPIFMSVNQMYWIWTCLPLLYEFKVSTAIVRTQRQNRRPVQLAGRKFGFDDSASAKE